MKQFFNPFYSDFWTGSMVLLNPLIFIWLTILVSCNESHQSPNSNDEDQPEQRIVVTSNNDQIVISQPSCQLVLILFDPQGNPENFLGNHRIFVGRNICVVASKISKNGAFTSHNEKHIHELLQSTRRNYPSANFWTIGFSGAAIAADQVAQQYSWIDGAILIGSPGRPTPPIRVDYHRIHMAGWHDFNLMNTIDQTRTGLDLFKSQTFLPFEGAHEWANPSSMRLCLQMATQLSNAGPVATGFDPSQSELTNLPQAALDFQNAFSDAIYESNFNVYRSRISPLLDQLKSTLTVERREYATLSQLVSQGDSTGTLAYYYRMKALANQSPKAVHFTKRATNLMSLMVYQKIVALDSSVPHPELIWWSNLYEIIDPTNPESHYRQAKIHKDDAITSALSYLTKSIKLGFKDTIRYDHDFGAVFGTNEELRAEIIANHSIVQ